MIQWKPQPAQYGGALELINMRLWLRVRPPLGIGECWRWLGHIGTNGYGRVKVGLKQELTHRVAYQLLKGKIPDDCELDHLCRNRACVNPHHLEAVPHKVNVLRGNSFCAQNARKTHCPNGHPYEGRNITNHHPNRKSTERTCRICHDQKEMLRKRELRVNGYTVTDKAYYERMKQDPNWKAIIKERNRRNYAAAKARKEAVIIA